MQEGGTPAPAGGSSPPSPQAKQQKTTAAAAAAFGKDASQSCSAGAAEGAAPPRPAPAAADAPKAVAQEAASRGSSHVVADATDVGPAVRQQPNSNSQGRRTAAASSRAPVEAPVAGTAPEAAPSADSKRPAADPDVEVAQRPPGVAAQPTGAEAAAGPTNSLGSGAASRSQERASLPARGVRSRSRSGGRHAADVQGQEAGEVEPAVVPAVLGGGAASSSGAARRRDRGCIAAEPLSHDEVDAGGEAGGRRSPAEAADGRPAGQAEEGRHREHKKKEKKSKKEKDKGEKKRKSSEVSGSEGKKKKKQKHAKDPGEAREAKDAREANQAKDAKDGKAPAVATASPTGGVVAFFKPVKVQVLARQQERDRADAAAKLMEGKAEEEPEKQPQRKDGKEPATATGAAGNAAAVAAAAQRPRRSKWDVEKAPAAAKGVSGLGDLGDLRRRLEDDRNKLRLWVIKAKQEWEERHEQVLRGQAPGATNEEEYYIASPGEVFGPQGEYQAQGSIGKGVFSSVFRCKSTKDGSEYAIKFVRSNHMMSKAAEKEVETYRRLAKLTPKEDAEATPYLMFLAGKETFVHQGHLCMVFELQRCDLRSALQKYGQGRGLPLQTVAQYSRQIFTALRALRRMHVIHGDLKPDNLLMSMAKTEIKICDFGSAMEVSDDMIKTEYMQPRYYRAPEIMIGSPYDTQIDLWSAGVTLFELGTGKILFTGKTNNIMLQQMLEVCGAVPRRMSASGGHAHKHFNAEGDFLYKDPDSITGLPELLYMRRFAKPSRPVQGLLDRVLKEPPPNADTRTQERLLPRLGDLVAHCLRMDPSERFTPDQALAHQFHRKDR